MLDWLQSRDENNLSDQSYLGKINALYQHVLFTIATVEEIANSLSSDYSEDALFIISKRFEEISKEYKNFTIVVNDSFYEVIMRSKSRWSSVNKVAQQAKSVAQLFEKYARMPKSYSAVNSRFQINKLIGELNNLAISAKELSGDLTTNTMSPENKKNKKTTESNLKSEIEPPVNEPPEKHDGDPSDEVSFTAFYPKEGKIDTWHTLLVYAHLLSATKEVYQDANRFNDQLPMPKEIGLSSSTRIARGTEITIVPTCDGITFNPKRLNINWMEDYHRAYFRFRADKTLLDNFSKGLVTIFVGPLIIGTLRFSMLFNNKDEVSTLEQEEHSTMYHKDKIFISYSHKDTDIVLAFKKVHEATGYDVLIDIDDLRSGQEWNPALIRMIDHADIFQLFWSNNSKKSKYCKQEWKHALKRAAEGFIRPVYWNLPLPNPPKELSKYHFEYVDLHESSK